MSAYEPNTVYALIKMTELARIFDRARDDDIAASALYFDELAFRLKPYGIEVVAVEMPGDDEVTNVIRDALDREIPEEQTR